MSIDAVEILRRHAAALEEPLKEAVERNASVPPRLKEAMLYSLLASGKRLRPALVLESHIACGGRAEDSPAIAAAVAIELVHTFSLVHDDLPAMDDDDLRRGRPTNHKVFGEALAILSGDAMLALAFETLARDGEASVAVSQIVELASAAGPAGMIGGQVLDIEGENQQLSLEALGRVHRMKTAALITCACRMGAIAARAGSRLGVLSDFGTNLGVAFQIVDDLLDVTSTPQQLGKKTNKDTSSGKNTYPRLMGIDASRAAAEEHAERAMAALAGFGDEANGLRAIANFVTRRQT